MIVVSLGFGLIRGLEARRTVNHAVYRLLNNPTRGESVRRTSIAGCIIPTEPYGTVANRLEVDKGGMICEVRR